RLLAAADAYDAMTHDRPHRAALEPRAAREALGGMVRGRTLDGRAVDAVLQAAGAAPLRTRQRHPAGLTDREVDVLRLVAQGRTARQIAATLVITEKTAAHHIEHIYAKTGVSSRAGAALFAMRHDLAG
ncbi:MAG TPA: LuxR C-terminal-related transcriptional regulator, partial [Solirubrobacteraceae bacterium]|nr:LuxR C-terminal-related transcriptional regulator [Solirubrobacteraceae bacterium]